MQVEGLRLRLDPPPRVRLFTGSDLHVTLGFLGAVEEKRALSAWEQIADFTSLRRVAGSFTGIAPLGNPRKPSALCALIDRGRKELSEMIVEARGPLLRAAGVPEDSRPPLPHMTLARIQRRANAAERRAALTWAKAIDLHAVTFEAPSVALYTWSDDRQERLFRIVEQLRFAR
jgi:2'-5' RNA ligase